MKDDDASKLASQFINMWQENFSKAIADQKITEYMMNTFLAAPNMQQFYDKFTSAANPHLFSAGFEQLYRGQHDGRINELERRITALEKRAGAPKGKNRKSGKR